MSQELYQKDHGPVDEVRDRIGLYRLGFELWSFLGFVVPWAIVIVIGGALGLFIWKGL